MTTKLQIIILFSLLAFSCSQTKTSDDNSKQSKDNKGIEIYYQEYNCLRIVERCGLDIIKLINRDTLIYVSSDESQENYEEVHGKLTQINDSIFYVRCFKHLTLSIFEDHGFEDSLLFICDSNLINKKITIEYQNKNQEQYKVYSTRNLFRVNKDYFNSADKKLKLNIEYPHPIVDENIMLFALNHGGTAFTSDKYFSDFYIVIDSTKVKSINISSDSQFAYGPKFNLKRLPGDGRFSMGRKLRGQKNGT